MSEKPEIELKQVMYHKMVYEFDNPDQGFDDEITVPA